jgi:hypothetical protein
METNGLELAEVRGGGREVERLAIHCITRSPSSSQGRA